MSNCFSGKHIKLASRLTFSTALLGLILANSSYAMDKPEDGRKKPPVAKSKTRRAPKPAKTFEKVETASRPYIVPAFIQPLHDSKEDYPKIYFWLNVDANSVNLQDIALANSLVLQGTKGINLALRKGVELKKQNDFNCFSYLETVINYPKTPPFSRDLAILERAQALSEIVPKLVHIKENIKRNIWGDSLRCLHFLADKESTSKYQKGSIFCTLADYYNPLRGSLCPQPKNVEYFAHEALKYEFNPEHKAILLDDIATLYQYRHLGTGENLGHKACEYYDLVIQNNALPIKYRFHARLSKIDVLLGKSDEWQNKTIEEQKISAQVVLDEANDFPELQKKAKFYYARLLLKEYDLAQGDRFSILDRAYIALHELYQDTSLFDAPHIQHLKISLVNCLNIRMFDYNIFGDSDFTDLNKMLGELIHQKAPPSKTVQEQAVIRGAEITSQGSTIPSFWGQRNPGALLDSILQNPSATSSDKNEVKAIKAVLVAKGLVPKAMNHEDLKDLNDALKSSDLSKRVKLMVLITLVQKTQERFPHYNNQIKELVNYLKKALLEETDPIDQKKLSFILYTYFQAYKECPITSAEAAQYVQNLSSEDTPEALRIHITRDEDSDEERGSQASQEELESAELERDITPTQSSQLPLPSIAFAAPENIEIKNVQALPSIPVVPQESGQGHMLERAEPSVESTPPEEIIDLEPWRQYESKDVDPRDRNLTSGPKEASAISSENADPLLSMDSQRARNLHHAQLLLEKLAENRGKINQSEVANMLRRLDYTFQPTADNGLTLHLGHKGRKNKKGTPGRLDGGRKADLAVVLRDAIAQASTTRD